MADRERRAQLARILDVLDPQVCGADDRRQLHVLRDQLRKDRFRVLVAGEAKRGKSTLLNALLGRDVLPTGVVPVTALATTVRDGGPEGVTVRFDDGSAEHLETRELPRFVTQRDNPGNRLGVSEVILTLHAPLLADGVELVDTPGTGSVHGQNTEEAMAALRTMDAALFVLTADPPISAAEHELLRRVAQASVHTFVVLNKADLIPPADLPEATAFTRSVVTEALGEQVPVHVCTALAYGRNGVDELSAALSAYLAEHRDADLLTSLTRRTRHLAGSLLDEVLLAQAVASLDASRRRDRLTTLHAHLDTLAARRDEAASLVRAQERRILADVNAAAQRAAADLTAQVGRALGEVWEENADRWPARRREAAGRERLVELTRTCVDAWRGEQERGLTGRFAELDQRLRERLAGDLDALREDVADLLGVALALRHDGAQLAANPRFRYHFAEDVGQTELLAGWARRHMPGEVGRERAWAHLERETASLVPMQVGRVRADLQQRLAESRRTLECALVDRYESVGRRLRAAVDAAEAPGGAEPAERARASAALAAREQVLREVIAELTVESGRTPSGETRSKETSSENAPGASTALLDDTAER